LAAKLGSGVAGCEVLLAVESIDAIGIELELSSQLCELHDEWHIAVDG